MLADGRILSGSVEGQKGKDFKPGGVPSMAVSSEPANGFEVKFESADSGFWLATMSLFQLGSGL